jgi:hypothetical protein
MTPDPADTTEWDNPQDWSPDLSELRDAPETAELVPATTSELVLVADFTQTAWDRRIARQLRQAEECETYLRENVGTLPDAILVRNCLRHLGYDRAAKANVAAEMPSVGPVYLSMVTPPKPAPKKRRTATRKTATAATDDPV